MRRFLPVLLLVAVLTAACAPAAGRPAVAYLANQQEIIGAVAQFGPLMTPPEGYNFFSIETIGEAFITLRADVTTGVAIIQAITGAPREPARVTITTFEQPGVTRVAVSVIPGGLTELYDAILGRLDARFQRANM